MLVGATNFRDLGGLPVTDGRRVRFGQLHRSNSLTKLSDDDLAVMDELGLRTVIDLRTVAERSRSPSRWSSNTVNVVASKKADTTDMLAALVGNGDSDEAAFRSRFSAFYAGIPELYADEYREMFRALAAGETPMLINCSAGKDRTGVAVMLILAALEVDHEAAVADYLRSAPRLHDDPGFAEMLSSTGAAGFGRLPQGIRTILLGVDRAHIEAALAAVARDYGSVAGYLETRLGLTAEGRLSMQRRLTEPAPHHPDV